MGALLLTRAIDISGPSALAPSPSDDPAAAANRRFDGLFGAATMMTGFIAQLLGSLYPAGNGGLLFLIALIGFATTYVLTRKDWPQIGVDKASAVAEITGLKSLTSAANGAHPMLEAPHDQTTALPI